MQDLILQQQAAQQRDGGLGDVASSARGSGARYNSGKAPLELIPLWIIADAIPMQGPIKLARFHAAFADLGEFQKSQDKALLRRALCVLDAYWGECAEVFDYGRKKYAEWNWAKGMSWSAVLGCASRHATAALVRGQESDPESGKSHLGHFMCNLVMLRQFVEFYPEGNDLPSIDLFKAS